MLGLNWMPSLFRIFVDRFEHLHHYSVQYWIDCYWNPNIYNRVHSYKRAGQNCIKGIKITCSLPEHVFFWCAESEEYTLKWAMRSVTSNGTKLCNTLKVCTYRKISCYCLLITHITSDITRKRHLNTNVIWEVKNRISYNKNHYVIITSIVATFRDTFSHIALSTRDAYNIFW